MVKIPDISRLGSNFSDSYRLPVAAAAVLVYCLLFFPLFQLQGFAAGTLSVVPVVVASWLLGMRRGLAMTLAMIVVNFFLLHLASGAEWAVVMERGGIPGSLALIMVGSIIGLLHDWKSQLKAELARRQQVEAALEQERNLLRTLIDSLPALIYVKDTHGRFIIGNVTVAHIMGAVTSQDLEGKTDFDFYPPELAARYRADEEMVIQSGQPLMNQEEPLLDRQTTRQGWLLTSKVPLRKDNDTIWGVIGIGQDITERKQVEAERLQTERLKAEVEKERELIHLKESFLSMVSHEFRTPLTVIISAIETLETYRERLTAEKQQNHLHKIRQQAERMTQLLNDVLTVSKAKAGKMEVKRAPVDTQQFCRAMVEQVELTSGGTHRVALACDSLASPLMMDENLLQHILVNLLSNAVKYSPPGSEICLDVHPENGQLVVQVMDQGIGISNEAQAHLFEPFFRADNASRVQGTGLGLVIVKASVEAHGGTIQVASQEGKGTTFTIRIPLN